MEIIKYNSIPSLKKIGKFSCLISFQPDNFKAVEIEFSFSKSDWEDLNHCFKFYIIKLYVFKDDYILLNFDNIEFYSNKHKVKFIVDKSNCKFLETMFK